MGSHTEAAPGLTLPVDFATELSPQAEPDSVPREAPAWLWVPSPGLGQAKRDTGTKTHLAALLHTFPSESLKISQ